MVTTSFKISLRLHPISIKGVHPPLFFFHARHADMHLLNHFYCKYLLFSAGIFQSHFNKNGLVKPKSYHSCIFLYMPLHFSFDSRFARKAFTKYKTPIKRNIDRALTNSRAPPVMVRPAGNRSPLNVDCTPNTLPCKRPGTSR